MKNMHNIESVAFRRASDNPRFDCARFLIACGVSA